MTRTASTRDVLDHAARAWLSRIEALRRPCDVDVLLFFATHRRTLMTVEQLAPLLGCPVGDIALALDGLIRAGFVTQTAQATRPPPLFVYTPGGTTDPRDEFVAFASERRGRLALRLALTRATATHAGGSVTVSAADAEGER